MKKKLDWMKDSRMSDKPKEVKKKIVEKSTHEWHQKKRELEEIRFKELEEDNEDTDGEPSL